jgi:hypothetical protein
MAKGNEVASFSMKSTSATYTPGAGGSTVTSVNFEGTATGGFGTIAGTGVFVGAKAGTLSYTGVAYMDNGETMFSHGSGSFESTGQHHWKTTGVMDLSDGSRMLSEGEIDLAERTWTGKVYAWT